MSDIRGIPQVPRLPGQRREAGDFLLVRVVGRTGQTSWLVQEGSQLFLLRTKETQAVGQMLRVPRAALETAGPGDPIPSLRRPELAAGAPSTLLFMAHGLPLIAERIRAMEVWAKTNKTRVVPSEAELWSVSREARPWVHNPPGEEAMRAWLDWERGLLDGSSGASPEDGFQDLWNTLRPEGTAQWLLCPFDWEAGERLHHALLKAWIPNPEAGVERWTVLTSTGEVPVRVRCQKTPKGWQMTLHVFDESTYQRIRGLWKELCKTLEDASQGLELDLLGPSASPVPSLPVVLFRRVDDSV